MTIGSVLRRLLGPAVDPVARFYRSYYVDLSRFAEVLADCPEVSSVLEIGCGDGHLCEALAATFPQATVLGIDIADDPGRLYKGREEGVSFSQIMAEDLAEDRAGSFDLVVLCDVLHHVAPADRADLVAVAWSLLSEDGCLGVKDWVRTRNLASLLAYSSDRFITGDTPEFFDERTDIIDLLLSGDDRANLLSEGWVRPHRNNVYAVAGRGEVR